MITFETEEEFKWAVKEIILNEFRLDVDTNTDWDGFQSLRVTLRDQCDFYKNISSNDATIGRT